MKRSLYSLLVVLFTVTVNAQPVLKLEDAIDAAVKHHWTVQVAENMKKLSSERVSSSYLALLPDVSLNMSTTKAKIDLEQKFSSGLEVNRKGVSSSTTNGNLLADLTLFNGFRLFNGYAKYKEIDKAADLNIGLAREDIVYAVSLNYFSIIRKKLELNELNKSLDYSLERVKIAKTKFESGASAKPELLQAQIDLNTRKSEILRRKQELMELKSAFNNLIGTSPEQDFDVTDTLVVNAALDLKNLLASASSNRESELLQSRVKVSEYQLKENRSDYFPRIFATANYGFNLNKSEAGFSLYNKTNGLTTGLGLSWDLFSKGTRRMTTLTDKITIQNLMLEKNDVDQTLRSQVLIQHRKLSSLIEIYSIEKDNYSITTENLSIATERYKLGMSTMLELIEAQRNQDLAAIRLINANYESKLAELELKRKAGQLWLK
jgi:outer membrane protein